VNTNNDAKINFLFINFVTSTDNFRHMKKITSQRCDGYFVSGKEVGSADSELSKGSADAAWRKID